MPQVELSDQAFEAAQRRAAEGGYSTVEEYIADIVACDVSGAGQDFDHLFTPERLAELERISTEIKAGGKTHSMGEAREHFDKKRKAWLANQAT